MFGISLKTIPFPPLIKFDFLYMPLVKLAAAGNVFLFAAGEAGEV